MKAKEFLDKHKSTAVKAFGEFIYSAPDRNGRDHNRGVVCGMLASMSTSEPNKVLCMKEIGAKCYEAFSAGFDLGYQSRIARNLRVAVWPATRRHHLSTLQVFPITGAANRKASQLQALP